jgi:hypothetical protein
MGGASKGPIAPMERQEAITITALWFGLFGVLALLHAAEIAITTLYPWKVREFAEEEEKQGKTRGTFKILNEDITRVLDHHFGHLHRLEYFCDHHLYTLGGQFLRVQG